MSRLLITYVILRYKKSMHALRHHIRLTYKHQPVMLHLAPLTMRFFCASVRESATSSVKPTIEPHWPMRTVSAVGSSFQRIKFWAHRSIQA